MRIGRIPYINCFPVYGAIDRGIVPLSGELVTGVPSALNAQMAQGSLDVSVVSAVEYARDARRYLLLPDLAISCQGPVRSVLLFSKRPASELAGRRVVVSRSSMTSVLLLELLFEAVWKAHPDFVPGDAEVSDLDSFSAEDHEARLVIGDAALLLQARDAQVGRSVRERVYPHVYDLGEEWRSWTGLPFVFAVWVALRTTPVAQSLGAHASLIASRDWGLAHLDELSRQAAAQTGVSSAACREYFRGLDYGLGYEYLAGLTDFFKRLAASGRVPATSLHFLAA
ncbi:MAG: menaquinone biosynthetic enzyme MqnA/MqnD family protein [Gemmatimonadaceae bacterium]